MKRKRITKILNLSPDKASKIVTSSDISETPGEGTINFVTVKTFSTLNRPVWPVCCVTSELHARTVQRILTRLSPWLMGHSPEGFMTFSITISGADSYAITIVIRHMQIYMQVPRDSLGIVASLLISGVQSVQNEWEVNKSNLAPAAKSFANSMSLLIAKFCEEIGVVYSVVKLIRTEDGTDLAMTSYTPEQ